MCGRSEFAKGAAIRTECVELNPAAPGHQIRPWHELDMSDQRKDNHFASAMLAWLLENLELVPEDGSIQEMGAVRYCAYLTQPPTVRSAFSDGRNRPLQDLWVG